MLYHNPEEVERIALQRFNGSLVNMRHRGVGMRSNSRNPKDSNINKKPSYTLNHDPEEVERIALQRFNRSLVNMRPLRDWYAIQFPESEGFRTLIKNYLTR